MFEKSKLNKILAKKRKQKEKEKVSTPLETILELESFFESYYKLFQKGSSNSILKNDSENSITICLKNRFSFPANKKIAENVVFPSLIVDEFVNSDYLDDLTYWKMDLDSYETFFENNNIVSFKKFLEENYSKACNSIRNNPTDEILAILLLQNVEIIRTILTTMEKSIIKTSSIPSSMIDSYITLLTTFCDEVHRRVEAIKQEKEFSNKQFTKSMEEELLKEISYQRKMLELNYQNPLQKLN